jgi:hypothetical protein
VGNGGVENRSPEFTSPLLKVDEGFVFGSVYVTDDSGEEDDNQVFVTNDGEEFELFE